MHICFITTGDIKSIATSKRAIGMANPLISHNCEVSIIMEDTTENRHRISLECSQDVHTYFFQKGSVIEEIKAKNRIIKQIKPDYLYICAFVTRNIVGIGLKCKKLVEHSELQSGIPDIKGLNKLRAIFNEYLSIFYADGILNASKFLQKYFSEKCKQLGFSSKPNLYFPYAYSKRIMTKVDINFSLAQYQQYKEKYIFVFLGTITRNYGIFTILEAINLLKEKYSNFKVLILGKGRHYEEACSFLKEKNLTDYVEMPGYVKEEDIAKYFTLANCFISPMNDTIQDWARCPSKLYMYLPYNKAIITCKIGEPFEVLKEKGLYYTPNNSLELSKQMEYAINNPQFTSNINFELHSWEYRTNEFLTWIDKIKN